MALREQEVTCTGQGKEWKETQLIETSMEMISGMIQDIQVILRKAIKNKDFDKLESLTNLLEWADMDLGWNMDGEPGFSKHHKEEAYYWEAAEYRMEEVLNDINKLSKE
jgi:hypothetical protein